MLSQWLLTQSERETGASVEYLRRLRSLSGKMFWRLMVALASLRTAAPNANARAIASILAILQQDCGPCLEIAVRFARRERADEDVLRAALGRQPEQLSPPLRAVYSLAQAVFEQSPEVTELSRQVELTLGRAVAADVALTLAFSPIYPTLKRALGVATSHCVRPLSLLERSDA